MSVVTTVVDFPVTVTFSLDPTHAVSRVFVYAFHAAPTADLMAEGVAALDSGASPAALADFLLGYATPDSPLADLAAGNSNADFCAALVDSYCHQTDLAAEVRSAWVQELLPVLTASASRGAFIEWINDALDSYAGSDTSVLALKTALAARMDKAQTHRGSAEGARYEGGGWSELQAVLDAPPPPVPTYTLTSAAASVDEGASIVFTLATTDVAAGSLLAYRLSGVTGADLVGGSLEGQIEVDADGAASLTLTLNADARTEGRETLTLTLGDGLASATVFVNDTSLTPAPVPTYVLQASAATVDEGDNLTFTLVTTGIRAGSLVGFSLSGTGIAAADLEGSQLTGNFTINTDGIGTFILGARADATTEGNEVLRLKLNGLPTEVQVTLEDTSRSPDPVGAPDTVVIADDMNNPRADSPASPADGELRIETFLSYDLLKQSASTPTRMTLAQLRATDADAGAALDTGNRSADRGNIPQVSNQDLYTFDLGLQTDRIDYSAESGAIVAVISAGAPADRQFVLLNDDAVDTIYNDETDRIDTLVSIEQVVASQGGGVLDLTASAQAWEIRFSHNFDLAHDVVGSLDRAVHSVRLTDADSGTAYGRTYLEYRDAGASAAVSQAKALWSQVQGSDRNEEVTFSALQSTDDRTLVLRGGDNAVKYNELTRSVLADVAMTAWLASTSAADDSNSSGTITVSVQFTNGDGATLLGPATHVISSHGPDNRVAAGHLLLAATQDGQDAVRFDSTADNKLLVIEDSSGINHTTVRLAAGPATDALELTGFEFIHDNGVSDDLFVIERIASVADDDPALIDAGAADHDGIALTDDALGRAEVGGGSAQILLATVNGPAGLDFDFDVLDLRRLSDDGLTITGTADSDDELVLGDPRLLTTATLFESLVLTTESLVAGTDFRLDLDAGRLTAGATLLFGTSGNVLGASGLFYGGADLVPAVAADLELRLIDATAGAGGTLWGGAGDDQLTGGAGNDTLRGGAGDDTLEGGDADSDTFVFEASGAANGSDSIDDFTPGGDHLDVTAFTGGAITAANAAIDGALGGSFAGVATTVELVFNRSGASLAASDFATSPTAGRFVLADGARSVVAVTADPTGAAGNAAETPVLLYYVSNGAAAGLSDLSVSLVATVSAADELTLADIFAGLS